MLDSNTVFRGPLPCAGGEGIPRWRAGFGAASLVLLLIGSSAVGAETPASTVLSARGASFRNEVQQSIDRGLSWLQSNQNSNGWWSSPDQPALTALVVLSFKGDPRGRYAKNEPEWLKRTYNSLLICAQPDGGIHRSTLVTYNTSGWTQLSR